MWLDAVHYGKNITPFDAKKSRGRIHQIWTELFKNQSELGKSMANTELNVDEIVEKMIGYADRIDTPFGEMCTVSCDMG